MIEQTFTEAFLEEWIKHNITHRLVNKIPLLLFSRF